MDHLKKFPGESEENCLIFIKEEKEDEKREKIFLIFLVIELEFVLLNKGFTK